MMVTSVLAIIALAFFVASCDKSAAFVYAVETFSLTLRCLKIVPIGEEIL
jgi:hypothetical protein